MAMASDQPYRIIVCGGRDFSDYNGIAGILLEYVWAVDDDYPQIVHGGCNVVDLGHYNVAYRPAPPKGVDATADFLARAWRWPTPEIHWADWSLHGKRAGPIRNHTMAMAGANLCIAFPGGRGTANMIRCAKAAQIAVRTIIPEDLDATVQRRGRKYAPPL